MRRVQMDVGGVLEFRREASDGEAGDVRRGCKVRRGIHQGKEDPLPKLPLQGEL